jgi:hypothetical protein
MTNNHRDCFIALLPRLWRRIADALCCLRITTVCTWLTLQGWPDLHFARSFMWTASTHGCANKEHARSASARWATGGRRPAKSKWTLLTWCNLTWASGLNLIVLVTEKKPMELGNIRCLVVPRAPVYMRCSQLLPLRCLCIQRLLIFSGWV